MFPPLTCGDQLSESLASLGLCLTGLSSLLVWTGGLRSSLCSGGGDSLTVGEHEAVSTSGLVPRGREREDKMQSSMGNNLGSEVEEKQ